MKVIHLDNPQTWNLYAYVTNNPTTFNDPLGLGDATACWTYGGGWEDLPGCEDIGASGAGGGSGNPADPCSDPSFAISNAECGPFNPAGIPYFPPFGGLGGIGGGGIVIGGASSSGQTPMPAGGALCGPFGCAGSPFQNSFQEAGGLGLWEILQGLYKGCMEEDPIFCAKLGAEVLKLTVSPAKYVAHKVGTKAAANSQSVRSLQCSYAPLLCSNAQGQQNNRPWWSTGPTEPVPSAQPTVVLGGGPPLKPGTVVPIH